VVHGSFRALSGSREVSLVRVRSSPTLSCPRLHTRLRCRSTHSRVAWPFPLSSMTLSAICFAVNRGSDGTSRSLVHLPRLLRCRLRPLRLHSTSETRGIRAGFVLPPVCRPTRLIASSPVRRPSLPRLASASSHGWVQFLLLSTDVPRSTLRPLDSPFRLHRREIDFRFQVSGVSGPDGLPLNER